jgi:hypothetical protein
MARDDKKKFYTWLAFLAWHWWYFSGSARRTPSTRLKSLLSPNLPRIWSIENDPFDGRQGEYVLGVTLSDDSRAYPFDLVSGRGVTNDFISDVPAPVVAYPRDRSAHLFVRKIGGEPLEFVLEGGELRDVETGSLWSPLTGPGVTRRVPWSGHATDTLQHRI